MKHDDDGGDGDGDISEARRGVEGTPHSQQTSSLAAWRVSCYSNTRNSISNCCLISKENKPNKRFWCFLSSFFFFLVVVVVYVMLAVSLEP